MGKPKMGKPKIAVDKHTGFIYVNGVKVGRSVPNADGTPRLEFWDKCPRRSTDRGSHTVECTVKQLNDALKGDTPLTKD